VTLTRQTGVSLSAICRRRWPFNGSHSPCFVRVAHLVGKYQAHNLEAAQENMNKSCSLIIVLASACLLQVDCFMLVARHGSPARKVAPLAAARPEPPCSKTNSAVHIPLAPLLFISSSAHVSEALKMRSISEHSHAQRMQTLERLNADLKEIEVTMKATLEDTRAINKSFDSMIAAFCTLVGGKLFFFWLDSGAPGHV
jgi:hypothetical protein